MPSSPEHFLRSILSAARAWPGATWPNPAVGACVVHRGRLLGQGVHRGPGHPHAEVAALDDARARGEDARGATLYVTLEPCNHQGRTPPCTRAIREAGIAEVVIVSPDPNPHVVGGGAQALRSAGVRVRFAGARWAALERELNAAYVETRGNSVAHVTLKLAITRDGKLARRHGRVVDAAERAISGELAHRRAHRLRATSSCVLVGKGTVLADHPRLDVRRVRGGHQPRPVVLDGLLELPPKLLPQRSLVVHGPEAPEGRRMLLVASGCELIEVARDSRGLDWAGLLDALTRRDLGKVLVEGGARVAASLLASGRADRIHVFEAPFEVPEAAPEAPALPPPGYELCLRRRVGLDQERIYRRSGATDETGRA